MAKAPKVKQFQPMLAGTCDDRNTLKFPVIASEKFDGVRAVVRNGVLLSRKLKAIPNTHVQTLFGRPEYEGFDGELMLTGFRPYTEAETIQEGTILNVKSIFTATQSAVMRESGTPDVTFHVFDDFSVAEKPFYQRVQSVYSRLEALGFPKGLREVDQPIINRVEFLDKMEAGVLAKGGEGVMVRDINGPYKFGRSTVNEGWLLKIKRFQDSDAVVIGFKERMHNENEAEIDERGHTKRSSAKAGKTATGMMGSFHVRDIHHGYEFWVGSGMDDAQRNKFWGEREELVGQVLKYKFFELGSEGLPRFPVFLGFRHENDVDLPRDKWHTGINTSEDDFNVLFE